MIALGVITLVLTSFMMVYYAYLSRHTDRDVSFFMSIGIISIVLNLYTNQIGLFGIAWLYFVLALAFIGLGFAVSTSGSIAFYTSIGPWFKTQFSDAKIWGFNLLSFCAPLAGIILYFVNYRKNRAFACRCGKTALWGILVWGLVTWAILGPTMYYVSLALGL